MFTLIVDTSTEKGIIMIAHDNKVVFEMPLALKAIKGSTVLFSTIRQGFETLSITGKDLKLIAVGVGPGSFTGIRVAASLAKGLATGLGIPLMGFCSLLGFVSYKEGSFTSLIPTKMGGSYVLKRLCKEGEITELSDAAFVSQEKIDLDLFITPQDTFPCSRYLAKMIEKRFLEKKYSEKAELEISYLNPSLW